MEKKPAHELSSEEIQDLQERAEILEKNSKEDEKEYMKLLDECVLSERMEKYKTAGKVAIGIVVGICSTLAYQKWFK